MDRLSAERGSKRGNRRNVALTLLCIFIGLVVVYPAVLHVMVWYFALKAGREPAASVMPRPLLITDMADLSHGAEAKVFGYSLKLPWPVVKQRSGAKNVTWQFADGVSASVFEMSGDSMGPGLLVNLTPAQVDTYRKMYGDKALSSKYEFLRDELNTSAADVSFWNSRARNAAVMTQLMLKASPLQKSRVLYAFNEGMMRGFQSGDPAAGDPVNVWLFDPSDRETWILFRRGAKVFWTQAQINAVIASIQPTQ